MFPPDITLVSSDKYIYPLPPRYTYTLSESLHRTPVHFFIIIFWCSFSNRDAFTVASQSWGKHLPRFSPYPVPTTAEAHQRYTLLFFLFLSLFFFFFFRRMEGLRSVRGLSQTPSLSPRSSSSVRPDIFCPGGVVHLSWALKRVIMS